MEANIRQCRRGGSGDVLIPQQILTQDELQTAEIRPKLRIVLIASSQSHQMLPQRDFA